HDAKAFQTINAPLPLDRVKDAAVFEVIGVDFTGPVYLKGGQKSWICLFTCAVFRAVHLELVTSLSTAAFLMAIRRFIARRGRPSVIYSDNGTNFVGLNNMFKQLDFEKLSRTLATERIQWTFNPPSAAWWGGFWDRLNGVLKRLLRRTLKRSCLDYEEMLTVLLDCEAVINSRPITFLSESKQDILPITPSMFLQEIKEIGVLDLDKIEKCDLSKRYLYRQKIKEDLRQRFRTEYLGALIHRKSNAKTVQAIEVGDIVLIENENVKRLDWPLARVKELIAGKDNNIRVVRLTTARGELIRPIQRLYPLELRYEKSESKVDEIIADKCKDTRRFKESRSSAPDISGAYDKRSCDNKSYSCAMKNCPNISGRLPGLSFFPFREIQKVYIYLDFFRSSLWLRNCGRTIETSIENLHKNYRVCENHFELSMFLNDLKNRLQPHAFPIPLDNHLIQNSLLISDNQIFS
ncbi:PREDICTED: uncharacterized protein LOC105566088, partial [Vollenhovia emeryi]|uniref:uncharacterized protein LOC105566088 n=1 Tax=Vollenhovia emeryi TaxID=411798 RepID=UPI0005F5141B